MKQHTPPLGLPVFAWGPEYKEKPTDYVFTGHTHEYFELCYLDRGPVHVLVDGNGFTGRTGDFFLFFPGNGEFHATGGSIGSIRDLQSGIER